MQCGFYSGPPTDNGHTVVKQQHAAGVQCRLTDNQWAPPGKQTRGMGFIQAVVAKLRPLVVRPDAEGDSDTRRLSTELSELATSNGGRGNRTGDSTAAATQEDTTSVVALLSVAGLRTAFLCCFVKTR